MYVEDRFVNVSNLLKQQLQMEWPRLTFVSQPGQPDLSVADAVSKFSTLGTVSHAHHEEADMLMSEMENDSDESSAYKAMSILRKRQTSRLILFFARNGHD